MGIHGFWRSYRNIDRLVSEELNLDPRRVFTGYERSALHTKVRLRLRLRLRGDASTVVESMVPGQEMRMLV